MKLVSVMGAPELEVLGEGGVVVRSRRHRCRGEGRKVDRLTRWRDAITHSRAAPVLHPLR